MQFLRKVVTLKKHQPCSILKILGRHHHKTREPRPHQWSGGPVYILRRALQICRCRTDSWEFCVRNTSICLSPREQVLAAASLAHTSLVLFRHQAESDQRSWAALGLGPDFSKLTMAVPSPLSALS